VIAYTRCEVRAGILQVGDVKGDTAQFYDIWAAANAVNIMYVLREWYVLLAILVSESNQVGRHELMS
jgi:hypothetical protein